MSRKKKRTRLIGATFGRLTVLADVGERCAKRGEVKWLCICCCGNTAYVKSMSLIKRHTKSCGCLVAESSAKINFRHGHKRLKVNGGKSPEYSSWLCMKYRCERPKHEHYKYYGGRGISVCERWKNSFQNFLLDMGLKPGPKYSIDRINNDGNYEPGNCRWATSKEQAENKSKRTSFSNSKNEVN